MINPNRAQNTIEKDPIDSLRWPAMPDPKDAGRRGGEIWMWPRIRCHLQVDPTNVHGEGFLVFPYAVSVFNHQGKHILSVVLEQTDYRTLSQLSGTSLRELREDTKGNFSPLHSAIYSADRHEDLGPYDGSLEKDAVRQYLLEIVAEELDLWGDPLLRGTL